MDNNNPSNFTYIYALSVINKPENEERYKVLSYNEERELIESSNLSDEDIRHELVTHNIRLVVPEVKKFSHRVSSEDLFQCGICGLMDAVTRFNFDSKNKFSSYAYWYVKKHVYDCFTTQNDQFDGTTNGMVTSIDQSVGESSSDMSMASMIHYSIIDDDDTINQTPITSLSDQDDDEYRKVLISNIIESGIITTNETIVVNDIYFNNKPRKIIAEEMGISKAMVGMHHKKAMAKLKKHLKLSHQIAGMRDL